MPKAKKIYALFVAINDYAHVKKLEGCVNDATRVSAYLAEATKEQGREFHCLTLCDTDATKKKIVKAFLKHLGQAGKDDICLFYFSGHGGQENAHPAFEKHESDGKIEILACQDSDLKRPGSFLADKEVGYLIRKLYSKTQADILTVFDCCHSGGNTRTQDMIPRNLKDGAGKRKWKDFIFSKEVSAKMVEKAQALEEVLPQGRHLQLAACEGKQVAWEVGGGGVFSTNFISLLRQTKGDISYQDLINVMRLRIGFRYKQMPQTYAIGGKDMVRRSFLSGITSHQKHLGNIAFDQERKVWALDMGAIHGIRKDNPCLEINLLDAKGKVREQAAVANVLPDSTYISLKAKLDPDSIHKAAVSGVIVSPLGLYCEGTEADIAAFKKYFDKNSKEAEGLEIMHDRQAADYLIHAGAGVYSVRNVNNGLAVTQSYEGRGGETFQAMLESLRHIGQWRFVKDLNNPNSNIQPMPPIKMKIYRKSGKKEKKVDTDNGVGEMDYDDIPPTEGELGVASGEMRIRLKNKTKQTYYCALLYLSQDFAIIPDLLEGGTVEVLPGKELWVWGGQPIPYSQESFIRQFNWEEETHYLKLIMSTAPFDVSRMSQDALPHPDVRGKQKGIGFKENSNPDLSDWCTHLIELRVPNPYFK